MVYLDLEELPSLVGDRAMIKSRSASVRSFHRADHLFDDSISLQDEVRQLVQKQTGRRPSGPIRLLTQLRHFGYYFSPLNLFYIFDQHEEYVQFVVAEVNNTPWNERHCYTLWAGNRTGGIESLRFSHNKDFHVSPFMHMDLRYRWTLNQPGKNLNLSLANVQGGQDFFHAELTLERRELTIQCLNRSTLRYPFVTAKIAAAIYFQALQLWWKKCPFHTHPKK